MKSDGLNILRHDGGNGRRSSMRVSVLRWRDSSGGTGDYWRAFRQSECDSP